MPIIGAQQSPIRIDVAETLQTVFPSDYFEIRYAAGEVAGRFKNHNFVLDKASRQPITYRGTNWRLHKIHIHSPSEHLLDSASPSDFECHLVHFAATDAAEIGGKLVIGVLFREKGGATTPPSLKRLNERMRDRSNPGGVFQKWRVNEMPEQVTIDPNDFLPTGATRDEWYRYEGSLTTGTFSEDVSWFVMRHQIEVDPADIDKLREEAEEHARVTQALDRRFILRSFAVS